MMSEILKCLLLKANLFIIPFFWLNNLVPAKSENIIKAFRTAPEFRIAVTVDMIATGTDIKPLECLLFLRDVRSQLYFEQMKGRGTRTLDPNDLAIVTPDAGLRREFSLWREHNQRRE